MIQTKKLFAHSGVDGVTMRKIAKHSNITLSVIYHYFPNKDILLKHIFDETNHQLGELRKKLPEPPSAKEMLRQRIYFQFDHALEIVFVLKYYVAYRKQFPHLASGFIPEKGYLHIQEVLEFGNTTHEFKNVNVSQDAKVITHLINGFLLEYFPRMPKNNEQKTVIDSIYYFILRALT